MPAPPNENGPVAWSNAAVSVGSGTAIAVTRRARACGRLLAGDVDLRVARERFGDGLAARELKRVVPGLPGIRLNAGLRVRAERQGSSCRHLRERRAATNWRARTTLVLGAFCP